jgi:hypothetical protein
MSWNGTYEYSCHGGLCEAEKVVTPYVHTDPWVPCMLFPTHLLAVRILFMNLHHSSISHPNGQVYVPFHLSSPSLLMSSGLNVLEGPDKSELAKMNTSPGHTTPWAESGDMMMSLRLSLVL